MKEYQGHRSWNCWNVALWIGGDEDIYNFAMECLKKNNNSLPRATLRFMGRYNGEKTPDGGVYNYLAVRLALETFIED